MPGYRIRFRIPISQRSAKWGPIVLAAVIMLSSASCQQQKKVIPIDTQRLEQDQESKPISSESRDRFLLAVTGTKELVNAGQAQAARKAFDKLKEDFPEFAGADLDAFIKAEMFFCRGKLAKAAKSYDKLLAEYPESELYEAALDRQFAIAEAFLAGRKKTVLGIFKITGYAEGAKIMEQITDRAGMGEPNGIGTRAAVAVAESYENRGKFNEAYLKWSQISSQWEMGQIGKNALLGMARCKHAVYNKHQEHKRHFYGTSSLITAKSYYEKFKLLYPEDAEELGVDKILDQIDEQLAYKQLSIGRYYQRTGKMQAANLYYNMVIQDWPGSKAAEMAKEMLNQNLGSEEAKNGE